MKPGILFILLDCILLLIAPQFVSAQRDYYITDSTIHLGHRVIDGGSASNSEFCQVRMGKKIVKYSPNEVNEFGFKDGSVFYAHEIKIGNSIKQVFLQRLVSGKMNLYYYQDSDTRTYFIEKDSGQLIALPHGKSEGGKENYKGVLIESTKDCDNIDKIVDMMTYHTSTMKSFVEAYNTCTVSNFNYFKYGFFAGYVNTKLLIPPSISPEFLRDATIENDGSFTFSLFMDLPLGKKGFYLHPEAQFVRNNFDYFNDGQIDKQEMVINTSCLNLPILLKYVMPIHNVKAKPYLGAGGMFSILLSNETIILESKMIDEFLVPQKYYNADLLAGQYIGYIASGGFQFNLYHRINLFTEFRYVRSFSMIQENRLDKGEFFFLTGLSF